MTDWLSPESVREALVGTCWEGMTQRQANSFAFEFVKALAKCKQDNPALDPPCLVESLGDNSKLTWETGIAVVEIAKIIVEAAP